MNICFACDGLSLSFTKPHSCVSLMLTNLGLLHEFLRVHVQTKTDVCRHLSKTFNPFTPHPSHLSLQVNPNRDAVEITCFFRYIASHCCCYCLIVIIVVAAAADAASDYSAETFKYCCLETRQQSAPSSCSSFTRLSSLDPPPPTPAPTSPTSNSPLLPHPIPP